MFDAGGVLWDLKPSHEELFSRTLASRGFDVEPEELRTAIRKAERLMDNEFAALTGTGESEFWRDFDAIVLRELSTDADPEDFSSELSDEFRSVLGEVESWVPYPDAVPTLEAARNRDFKLGLISNATELARRVLRNLDMERFFDFVVISEEVGVRKPDPRIFQMALKMANTRPERSLFLGDKPATDAMGATRAGMMAVLVDRNDVFPDSPFMRIRTLDTLRRFL
jgi:putative hydrolase of the HAD superfamily